MLWKNPFAGADAKAAGQPPVREPGRDTRADTKPLSDSGLVDDGSVDLDGGDGSKPKKKPKEGEPGHDPMTDFDTLWHPNVGDDGKPVPDSDDEGTYMPSIKPENFSKMLEKMDFTRNITPEEDAAITAGGAEGAKAMRSILNKSHRQNFATMFNAVTKMTEAGFKSAQGRFMKGVPDSVREMMVDNGLSQSNPIMKNPAFAPMVGAIRKQLQKKHPKATAAEIETSVNAYFNDMADNISSSKADKTKDKPRDNATKLREGAGDANFEEWFESELGSGGAKE